MPDVLEVIADLSNDEVFTPPAIARSVLDLLPAEIWTDPNARFLDPATKTGVFLREITRRLMGGLSALIPDEDERLRHILTTQVYGAAITELTALMSRRTVYLSRTADGSHSAVKMPTGAGNIWFRRIEHSYGPDGRCSECGAARDQIERDNRENHAYAFIHENGRDELQKEFDMKFDVVVGNPPYQLEDGGHGTSASPIYQHFVEGAIALNPRYILMITPSRWFFGGKGLDEYRARMLGDRRLRCLVDYPKLYDGFPGVKIRGGVSYFLWRRDEPGKCRVQTMWDGKPVGVADERYLDEFDVLVRRNEAVPILRKVRAYRVGGAPEPTLDVRVSQRKPFGLPTNFQGAKTEAGLKDPVRLHANQRSCWIERQDLPLNEQWVDEWKVLMTRVQGTSAAVETMFLSRPIVAPPGEACTETYLVAGRFAGQAEAEHLAAYLRTRFVRFLVSLRKGTQDAARGVYAFVPDLPLDREWTDGELYARYGITDDEQAFIENTVAEMAP